MSFTFVFQSFCCVVVKHFECPYPGCTYVAKGKRSLLIVHMATHSGAVLDTHVHTFNHMLLPRFALDNISVRKVVSRLINPQFTFDLSVWIRVLSSLHPPSP